ncbi:hypothetical protein K7887_18420 [Sutcliffiella horikoshii]|uniref:hypothetical protein n=1 Tax=Sutcliffiella horikoshii TaxID=79883 RepID=UPI001CBFB178|nr:hypothetical protein [Sutcliffiella horikoshii]UAL49702.1 hypothetical protein K7887_18420 [Sutcliffiella horikoshii]
MADLWQIKGRAFRFLSGIMLVMEYLEEGITRSKSGAFLHWQKGWGTMKLSDHLSAENKHKLNVLGRSKPKKKTEKVNWHEIMGSNRDTFKRVKGAIRRK